MIRLPQLRNPGLRPTVPTIRTPDVARRIAKRLVKVANVYGMYWSTAQVPARIAAIAAEIVRVGRPETVIDRLHRDEHLTEWDWWCIEGHCRVRATTIAAEELQAAVKQHRKDYGR